MYETDLELEPMKVGFRPTLWRRVHICHVFRYNVQVIKFLFFICMVQLEASRSHLVFESFFRRTPKGASYLNS